MDNGNFNPGPLGAWLEARAAMGRIQESSRQWCKAFDVGDFTALDHIMKVWVESTQDLHEAFKKAEKFQ